MSLQENNFEELLRQKFENFEADVRPDAWSQIQQQLGQTSATNSGNTSSVSSVQKASFWSTKTILTAITGTLAVAGITGAVLYNNISTKQTEEASNPVQIAEKDQPESSIEEQSETVHVDGENTPATNASVSAETPEVKSNTQHTEAPAVEQAKASEDIDAVAEANETSKVVPDQHVAENNQQVNSGSKASQSVNNQSAEVDPAATNQQEESKLGQIWDHLTQNTINVTPLSGKAPLEVDLSSFNNYERVQWRFGDGTPAVDEIETGHVYQEPGVYTITMVAQDSTGKVIMEKSVVEVKAQTDEILSDNPAAEQSELLVPNVFTPNMDGVNDELAVKAENIETYSLVIFNRNGEVVFESDSPENKWKGLRKNGTVCPEGVYFYQITAIGKDDKMYAPKGFVNLLR